MKADFVAGDTGTEAALDIPSTPTPEPSSVTRQHLRLPHTESTQSVLDGPSPAPYPQPGSITLASPITEQSNTALQSASYGRPGGESGHHHLGHPTPHVAGPSPTPHPHKTQAPSYHASPAATLYVVHQHDHIEAPVSGQQYPENGWAPVTASDFGAARTFFVDGTPIIAGGAVQTIEGTTYSLAPSANGLWANGVWSSLAPPPLQLSVPAYSTSLAATSSSSPREKGKAGKHLSHHIHRPVPSSSAVVLGARPSPTSHGASVSQSARSLAMSLGPGMGSLSLCFLLALL